MSFKQYKEVFFMTENGKDIDTIKLEVKILNHKSFNNMNVEDKAAASDLIDSFISKLKVFKERLK